MSDLQAKYQKLAAEYSKIRSQIPVLKKAVLDEQAANEEFKETIKSKDQSIRKFEQEVDSLTFRNQQLELRVSVLQKELEQIQPNHGKRQKEKKNSQVPNLTQSIEVIDEELRLKIEENAKLHRQVTELDQEHQKELSHLERRLQELEEEVARLQSELDDNKRRHHGDVSKLTGEKETLEEKIVGQESERLKSMEKVQLLEKELALTTGRLTRQLDRANKIICQKVSFNDTADESLNNLNVRCHRVQNQARSRDLMTQANQVSEGLIASFENLFGHIEVKVNALSLNSDFKGAADDLRQFLHSLSESNLVVQPLKASLSQLKESSGDDLFVPSVNMSQPSSFLEAFDNFVSYSKQIVSCELQCLEVELNQSSCTEMLSARISDLQRTFVQFATTLTDVHQVLMVLLSNNDVVEGNREATSRLKQLMQFSQVIMTWMEACKDLSRSYKSKSTLEHQLPTCPVNIKMADERIEGSLSDLVDSVSKLSSFLSSNVQSISDLLDSAFSSDHPCLPSLKAKAIKYRELISREAPESVPSSVAVQNRKLIECFAQNKNDLSQQVLQLQEKLNKVEQEREHWSLEAQLMTMKCKKEIEKFNALAKNSELSSQSESPDRHTASGMSMISELGKLEILNESGEVSDLDWVSTREKIVSDHYDRRIHDLISSLQQADSKALYFHSECRAIHKQLVACTKERDRLQAELNSTNQSMAGLRDELQTTSRSYEGQLSLMSEHLAGMNEKLTVQRDEIDALKYQLIQQQQQQNLQGSKNPLRRAK